MEMAVHPSQQLPTRPSYQVQPMGDGFFKGDTERVALGEGNVNLVTLKKLLQGPNQVLSVRQQFPLFATRSRVPIQSQFVIEQPELAARKDEIPTDVTTFRHGQSSSLPPRGACRLQLRISGC